MLTVRYKTEIEYSSQSKEDWQEVNDHITIIIEQQYNENNEQHTAMGNILLIFNNT